MSKQTKMPATETFIMDITVALSRYQRDVVTESVRRGMLHRAASGYAMRRPPLGYSTTETPGLFKINLFGTFLREELRDLANGYTTIESVAAKLPSAFDPFDSEPKLWSVAKVRRLALDPYYAGEISCMGQLYVGQHEPLLTEAEYRKLVALLKEAGEGK